jgi:transposase
MRLYAGIDLHSTNSVIGIVNKRGQRLSHAKVGNDLQLIVRMFSEYGRELVEIAVESTYNWYWLVDGLMDAGHRVRLANPAAIQQYKGLKHRDDRDDAFWLAEMLRLGILPEGYIYPKEDRPVRDLLRTRGILVRKRTDLLANLSGIITRNTGQKLPTAQIKAIRENRVRPLLSGNENLQQSGDALKDVIDLLSRRIRKIEGQVVKQVLLHPAYEHLQTLPGIGKILSLTIMLETGPIDRFPKAGNYVSYCRKVATRWTSNDKTKGRGNAKNGNRYLSWAFAEAAEHARRQNDRARAYYNRKRNKTNGPVAHTALAHKLARAAYYVMRNQEPFIPERVFG